MAPGIACTLWARPPGGWAGAVTCLSHTLLKATHLGTVCVEAEGGLGPSVTCPD